MVEKIDMSNSMTVLGLLNAMIGATALVLPLLGLKAGYIDTLLVSLAMGVLSFYTGYLIILHFGKAKSVKEYILFHFNYDYKYMQIYSFFIWFSFLPYFIVYFRLIVLQLQGIFGYYSWFGPAVAVLLIVYITTIRYFNVGQETIAIGIISIVSYLCFLIWAQITAPTGIKEVPAHGQYINLATALTMAYSIHDLLAQNILKNPNRKDYRMISAITFIGGALAYTFISYGSFAIVNRQSIKSNPEIIYDYFLQGSWQIHILQIIYTIHFATVLPNFMINSKLRFFQFFKVSVSPQMKWFQCLYISLIIIMSFFIFTLNINLQTIINLNGAIVGFFYVYMIPIVIHFKCVFFSKSSGYIEGQTQSNSQIVPNECQCDNKYKSKWTLYLQTVFLILILLIGLYFAFMTLKNVGK